MEKLFSKIEIEQRIERLQQRLNKTGENWDAVFIVDRISQYYFTGTMQDGIFVLKRDGSFAYFVRRSYERAKTEAVIEQIYPMNSYKDILSFLPAQIGTLYLDVNIASIAHLLRIEKYFSIGRILPVDAAVQYVRSIKSEAEIAIIREAGRQHCHLLQDIVPNLLQEGMNEADFTATLYREMVAIGYQGLSRFSRFQTEMIVGQIGFGDNSIFPTNFDGPGGMKGMSPAVPLIGERERKLQKGDLVFVDIGYGYNGYHSDCTQIYMFGAEPADDIVAAHNKCREIEKQAAALLKPGNMPENIYNSVMADVPDSFKVDFMGLGENTVKFLGHGVGLQIDEYPVIAKGFLEPLEPGMVIALEPKKSLRGVGVVGVEDTYLVSETGGICITGGEREIMVV